MPHSKPPVSSQAAYNQQLSGYFGHFGTGAHAQIFFMQTALEFASLDKVALISDIQGSERWPVQDLFQREVDIKRVTDKLIPYLRDSAKLKFFNPLTLTMLPVDPENARLLADLHEIPEGEYQDESGTWITLELKDHFRFRYLKDHPQYGVAEWNDTRVRIVAIDGQHRLSALKRIRGDAGGAVGEISKWTIPAVLFSARALSKQAAHQRILDVVRNIFVYINTEARPPSVTRQILLSDESVNAVCTQELLNRSHHNDLQEPKDRDRSIVPLMFFDWRGAEEGGREATSPAAVKSIREIRDWLEWYILGEDFDPYQEVALGIKPTDGLKKAFQHDKLSPELATLLRETFKQRVLPGIAYTLEHFTPYAYYIKKLRDIEDERTAESDIARYAFHKIRFGDDRAPASLMNQVKEQEKRILGDLTDAKNECFTELVKHDLGMRGVIAAYGDLRQTLHQHFADIESGWLNYSKWFTKHLNALFAGDLLRHGKDGAPALLKHVCYTHDDSVTNYRLDDALSGLGAFVSLFVLGYGFADRSPRISKGDFESERDQLLDVLEDTIFRGSKKEVRPQLKLKYPNGGKKLTEAVNEEARKLAKKQISRIRSKLDGISGY